MSDNHLTKAEQDIHLEGYTDAEVRELAAAMHLIGFLSAGVQGPLDKGIRIWNRIMRERHARNRRKAA